MPVPDPFARGLCFCFALSMDSDVPWDTRSIVQKARPSSITLEKGNLGTH